MRTADVAAVMMIAVASWAAGPAGPAASSTPDMPGMPGIPGAEHQSPAPARPVSSPPAVAPAAPGAAGPAIPSAPPSPAPIFVPMPGPAPSSSMLALALAEQPADVTAATGTVANPVSLFAVKSAEQRQFKKHDLVQIIVRETSQTRRSQDLETKKKYKLDGKINRFPDLNLEELLNVRLFAGRTENLPQVGVDVKNDFKGEGEYNRRDDMTDRLTATIVEVLPNGNLVIEARTRIKTDKEVSTMQVTGQCRSTDITLANTVLSNQVFDLKIERLNTGELKDGSKKGIIAKVLDTIFAF